MNGLGEEADLIEIIQDGYLQEANRQFFHPLGMSLAYESESGKLVLHDMRNSNHGVQILNVDKIKADSIAKEWHIRERNRTALLGYMIQPVV